MLTDPGAHRLAVWGDPIGHSKSPQLHSAAYRMLGLDWQYDRVRVTAAAFADTLAALDDTWRGLSITMPLKEEAYRSAAVRDRHAEMTGAVNTLLLGDEPVGFNTDIGGIVDALAEHGVVAATRVRLLGSGATAASALVAAAELGAEYADIRARRPERANALARLGDHLGIRVTINTYEAAATPVDLSLATLPSGTELEPEAAARLAASGGVLFDAAYAPWPSALAAAWTDAGIVSGLGMLLHQAVRQVRIFRDGDASTPLDDEDAIVAVMRTALDA